MNGNQMPLSSVFTQSPKTTNLPILNANITE